MSTTERCEWNPALNRPANDLHGCPNAATLSVGTSKDNWHLCASCAALPQFHRKTKRTALRTPRNEPVDSSINTD